MDDELQIEPKVEATKSLPIATQVMDIRPPSPAADNRLHNLPKDQMAMPNADSASPIQPTTARQSANGTGLAITATVIIVLGLASLATYAYLKTVG